MKISEIKNKELRELAESRVDEKWDYKEFIKTNELGVAFHWGETEEGDEFWSSVAVGIITEPPEEIQPEKSIAEKAFSNVSTESELRVANKIIEVLESEIEELRCRLNHLNR